MLRGDRKPITVYKGTECLGTASCHEWSEILHLSREVIYNYARNRHLYKGEYKFRYAPEVYEQEQEEKERSKPKKPEKLSEYMKRMRHTGKSYAELQKAETRKQVKVRIPPGLTSMREREAKKKARR